MSGSSAQGIARAVASLALALGLALAIAACDPIAQYASAPPTPAALSADPTAAPPNPTLVASRLAAGLPLFQYDASASRDVVVGAETTDSTTAAKVFDLTYASPKGGTVTALLVQAAGDGPHPALVILAGLPGTRRDLLPRALDLANAGVTSLLIDAPHARAARPGPGTAPINFTEQDREEQIQLIVDLRRAIDVLAARPDVDEAAIGFLGSSYGAGMGGLLAGIEPRVVAAVLESGDSGLAEHFTAMGDSNPLAALTPAARTQWLAAMKPIDSVYFVGNAVGSVLFQSGRFDPLVPAPEAARFAAAGNARSSIRWYDAGHGLSTPAWCEAAIWLGERLGFDGKFVTACGAAVAPLDPGNWIALLGVLALAVGVRLVLRIRSRRAPPRLDHDDDDEVDSRPIIRSAKR